ncbi:hypothetical protein MLD38_036644 [Melastoma candidum]|uniref:Uncharacterized protein n=1 Tax=Melastoma candidum TaxID=119954 RepID=A0ACB9LJN9_9MYRT|nr:hypothetical protein MLD38_036644 [Melastoma candidum]
MEYLHGILDDDSCDDKHAHAVASPSSQPSLASTSAYGPTQYPQSVSRQLLGLSDLLLPLLVRQVVSNKNHCSQKDQMSLRVRLSFVVLSPVGRPSRPVRIFALPCLLLCDLCPLSLCDLLQLLENNRYYNSMSFSSGRSRRRCFSNLAIASCMPATRLLCIMETSSRSWS